VASRNGAAGYKVMRSSHEPMDIDAGPAERAFTTGSHGSRELFDIRRVLAVWRGCSICWGQALWARDPTRPSLLSCSGQSRSGLEIKRSVARSARRPSLTGPVRDGLERPRVRTEGWAPKGAEQKDITCAVRKGLDKFALI